MDFKTAHLIAEAINAVNSDDYEVIDIYQFTANKNDPKCDYFIHLERKSFGIFQHQVLLHFHGKTNKISRFNGTSKDIERDWTKL